MTKQIFKFDKLVRDKIPEMIQSEGSVVHSKKLHGDKLVEALKNKLLEEAHEVLQAKSVNELKEELADVMEVLTAIASAQNIDLAEIEEARISKNVKRGGFNDGIYISAIEVDENNPAIKRYLSNRDKYHEITHGTSSAAREKSDDFWVMLCKLVDESEIVIDRPKHSAHPKFPDFIYPVDYGFLKGTKASDGNEIDIWIGTSQNKKINGILCTADPMKKDVETKIIYACTQDEINLICDTMNVVLKAIYIPNSMD
ncbi:MAG: hypothetical protein US49_C0011G0008 [candidate division TM6 bacterium GW2011_GWF2_37_49]|nr:MAG: hypothetical protein US49_C0011G0008 [candidate division TM6 bacterium GW2011_GWF2_37_49]